MELAKGDNYFKDHALAVNVCKINRRKNISHENDLTEIEHHHDFVEIVFITKGAKIKVKLHTIPLLSILPTKIHFKLLNIYS
jgi:hypothetical protein